MRHRFYVTLVLDLDGRPLIPATEDAALQVTGELQWQAERFIGDALAALAGKVRVIRAEHQAQFPEEADYPTDGTINWNMLEALIASNDRALSVGDNLNTVGFSHDSTWITDPYVDHSAEQPVFDPTSFYGEAFTTSPFCTYNPGYRNLDEDYD